MNKIVIKFFIIGLLSPMIVWAADEALLSNPVHIRSLAASCAACHGTMGNGTMDNGTMDNGTMGNAVLPTTLQAGAPGAMASLAGMDQSDFVAKLSAFKSGERKATVMHRHAKGLTDEEIKALAEYFASQSSQSSPPLMSQKLQPSHAN